KDRYTGGHTKRVYAYSDAIAAELPITETERERVRLAGLLHDIGKIGVPDRILQKPSELTESESGEMKSHTEQGYDIVSRVSGLPFDPWVVEACERAFTRLKEPADRPI